MPRFTSLGPEGSASAGPTDAWRQPSALLRWTLSNTCSPIRGCCVGVARLRHCTGRHCPAEKMKYETWAVIRRESHTRLFFFFFNEYSSCCMIKVSLWCRTLLCHRISSKRVKFQGLNPCASSNCSWIHLFFKKKPNLIHHIYVSRNLPVSASWLACGAPSSYI